MAGDFDVRLHVPNFLVFDRVTWNKGTNDWDSANKSALSARPVLSRPFANMSVA